ncbi:hypothetical protein ACOSP7_014433 [Xanthoceras sorbifolium]|uniref:Phytocyanin domain-containing protein n=1 Tax=Xanthoceras sorbifolium TaxID=99658 RepID=A0ABQ8I4Z7_9ROSI|nr:hypothetical protein JRO89_XS04G0117100 [Xanthoceras sorbifolium]
MALHRSIFIIFALISTIVPATTLAKEFIVGDEKGWTINFNYQAWAEGKDFRVGDKLVFKYPVQAHTVLKVNGTGFQDCIKPPANEALTSGSDEIVLATPGRKWYICGVGKHCESAGQKLFITVQPQSPAPAIAPSPMQAMAVKNTVYQLFFGILVAAVTLALAF